MASHILTLFKIYLGLVSLFLHAGLLSISAVIIKIKLVMTSAFHEKNVFICLQFYIFFKILCGILKIIMA